MKVFMISQHEDMYNPLNNAKSVDGVTVPDDGLGVGRAGAGTGVF